jgi:hypothetical protein
MEIVEEYAAFCSGIYNPMLVETDDTPEIREKITSSVAPAASVEVVYATVEGNRYGLPTTVPVL